MIYMTNMVDFFKTKFDAGPESARLDTLFVDVSEELLPGGGKD
jgi:hypothetical protein